MQGGMCSEKFMKLLFSEMSENDIKIKNILPITHSFSPLSFIHPVPYFGL